MLNYVLTSMVMRPFDGHHLYVNQAMSAPGLATPRFYHPQQHRVNSSPLPLSQASSQRDISNLEQQNRTKDSSGLSPLPSMTNFRFPPHPSQQPPMFASSNMDFSSFPPFIHESPRMDHNAFSPPIGLSSSGLPSDGVPNIASTPPANPQYAIFPFDAAHNHHTSPHAGGPGGSGMMTALTPGAQSQVSGSHATTSSETEKDPFLSLLEQLAENEQNCQGGPSELDFFLSGSIEGEAPDSDAQARAGADALVGLGGGVNVNGRPSESVTVSSHPHPSAAAEDGNNDHHHHEKES
jgi:hypothetical protein